MTIAQASLLLVDDDDLTRDLLAHYLEGHGFAVTGAADGEEALARIQNGGELLCQADAFVELPQRQQAGVGSQRSVGHLDLDGQRLEKIELEQGSGL